jgi:hypothetical protein
VILPRGHPVFGEHQAYQHVGRTDRGAGSSIGCMDPSLAAKGSARGGLVRTVVLGYTNYDYYNHD